MPLPDPTARFTQRVENYIRFRPSYPAAAVGWLLDASGVPEGATIADIGSGTGIFAALLLERGYRVSAVEPNDAMRGAAEAQLNEIVGFTSIVGTAEATTLADGSADLVVAAQAFHWFDPPRFADEARRILRPGGKVALIWNSRLLAGTPFADGYEQLLQTHGTDYRQVRHNKLKGDDFASFFDGPYDTAGFPHAQRLGREALRGRLLSSSYTPVPGHGDHTPMLAALDTLFDATAVDSEVEFLYETQVFVGRV